MLILDVLFNSSYVALCEKPFLLYDCKCVTEEVHGLKIMSRKTFCQIKYLNLWFSQMGFSIIYTFVCSPKMYIDYQFSWYYVKS